MIDSHDLGLLLASKTPVIVIESYEERLVLDMVSGLARKKRLPCFVWTVTEGLTDSNLHQLEMQNRPASDNVPDNQGFRDPNKILYDIKKSSRPGIHVLCDFHPYLENEPGRVRLIKDIALRYRYIRQTIIFVSHEFPVPPEFKHLTARLEIALPTRDQLVNMVKDESLQWARENSGTKIKTNPESFNYFVKNLQGLTFTEAKRLIRRAIDDGSITKSDVPDLNRTKFQLMNQEGVLAYEYDIPSFHDVGGLHNLKQWLEKRSVVFHSAVGVDIDHPKGILLIGVQGSGKSLAAKAVASQWGLPLLRLDFGTLYNKYFGETEKNLRESLKLAEAMAPYVLWMDEIEKGIGPDDSDQGVSKRLLASLLTWMAERTSSVFIVATANDIRKLPPELIRKGRVDEIFFIDLPDHETRQKIFSIHMKKRGIDPDNQNLRLLAENTEGFSGAEIEQSIVSALYSNEGNREGVTPARILLEIKNTVPLSELMDDEIQQLRSWAATRTVSAH
jgi:SpoVK/Ycf46/Vps4 family AAA+-type ATPase